MGASWAVLGGSRAVLGASSAVLGASWAVLGPLGSPRDLLGPSRDSPGPPLAPRIIDFPLVFVYFHIINKSVLTRFQTPPGTPQDSPRTASGPFGTPPDSPGLPPDSPGPPQDPKTNTPLFDKGGPRDAQGTPNKTTVLDKGCPGGPTLLDKTPWGRLGSSWGVLGPLKIGAYFVS